MGTSEAQGDGVYMPGGSSSRHQQGQEIAGSTMVPKEPAAGNGSRSSSTRRTGGSEEDSLQMARQLRQASITCPRDLKVTSP